MFFLAFFEWMASCTRYSTPTGGGRIYLFSCCCCVMCFRWRFFGTFRLYGYGVMCFIACSYWTCVVCLGMMSAIFAGSYSTCFVLSTTFASRDFVHTGNSIMVYFRWQLFVDTDDAMRPSSITHHHHIYLVQDTWYVCTAVHRHIMTFLRPLRHQHHQIILLVIIDSDSPSRNPTRDRPGAYARRSPR